MSLIIENSKIKNNPKKEKNLDIALWLRFLEKQKIRQLFEEIPDLRQQSKVKYPLSSLAMWALSLLSIPSSIRFLNRSLKA